jgi:hypothetical protein
MKPEVRTAKCPDRGKRGGTDSAPVVGSEFLPRRFVNHRPNQMARGMITTALLAASLGFCTWGGVNLHADPAQAATPYAEVYQRATCEFAAAEFFKPLEMKTNDLTFTLAPLILQQVKGTNEPPSLSDRFGAWGLSNGVPLLDPSHPAIYWEADAVQIRGKTHARFCYLWGYSPVRFEAEHGQRTNRVSSDRTEPGLPLQGIRITLNAAGQPVIWEVLADCSGAELFFISQQLEAAAVVEFGKPLPGRRYAIERSVGTSPRVIVARVIDDGPVAMGPILYLSAESRQVSTLICRCMPAQARKLLATRTYDLLPFEIASTNSLLMQARAMLKERAAFWPGDDTDGTRLQSCLRLPEAFSSSPDTIAR